MSNNYEKQYLNILEELLTKGRLSSNRTGTKTYKLWGRQMHIDLQEGFPALTTKKLHWKSIVHELLWMISGNTNIQYLLKNGVTFWSEWPYRQYEIWHKNNNTPPFCQGFPSPMSLKEFEQNIVNDDEFAKNWGSIGDFGYGRMWRDFPVNQYEQNGSIKRKILGVDQLHNVIEELKNNPDSRRIIISAWHPYHSNRKEDALLPACFPHGISVKTKDGFVDISDVEATHYVDSGDGMYRRVIEKYKTKYKGNILNIKYRYGLPIKCTENHPFLVKDKGFIEARDIKPNDFIGFYRNQENVIPSFEWQDQYGVKYSYIMTEDDMWCLGYFLGDGFVNFNLNKNQSKIHSFGICIHLDDINLISKFESTFNCKFYKKKGSGNSFTLMATSKKWVNVLRQFGHTCYKKAVPDFVLNAPANFITQFINGYIYADGHEFKNNFAATTVSPNIALGIQQLCVKIGTPCGITLSKRNGKTQVIESRRVKVSDLFYIRIPKSPIKSLYEIDEKILWVKVREVKKKPFNGYVYNLSVDVSHTFTSNNIITHNCHNYVQFGTEKLTLSEREDIYSNTVFLEYGAGSPYDKQPFGEVDTDNEKHERLTSFNVPKYKLNCYYSMRSNDFFLGNPFNNAFYALFTHLIANQLNMAPGQLVYNAADVHLYENHVEQAKLQLTRTPKELPKLIIKTPGKPIFDIKFEDLELTNYNPDTNIKAEVAI